MTMWLRSKACNSLRKRPEVSCAEWNRHREERRDAAIQESQGALRSPGLLRFARNDDRGSDHMQTRLGAAGGSTSPQHSQHAARGRE
jgi:hypothetical protein